jgi:hypothetical protein
MAEHLTPWTDIWITLWTGSPDAAHGSRIGYWLGIYSVIGVSESVALVAAT